jgi:hypothetical protein
MRRSQIGLRSFAPAAMADNAKSDNPKPARMSVVGPNAKSARVLKWLLIG